MIRHIVMLMAQYRAPIDVGCRDYFAPLTVSTLVRKISAGEIALPLVCMEVSQKRARACTSWTTRSASTSAARPR